MANRICPLCFGKVSRTAVVTHSNDVGCPHCGRALELSRPSRVLASFLGLAGGFLAFRFTRGAGGSLSWALPVLLSLLAFGIVSPLFLLLSADLVVKHDAPSEPVAAASAHGHVALH